MQKSALPKVLGIIVFILVSIIVVSNVSFAHPLSSTKYVTVTAKNDPGGTVEILVTYNGITYNYSTTSIETVKVPSGATVTYIAKPDNGFAFYGWNYTFEPYSMITPSTKFTFSTSQTLTFSNVQNSITAIAFFPVKLTIIDPAIWDYVTTSHEYYISFVGGVGFANNDSLVPSSLVSQNTFTLNVEVKAVGSSTIVSGSVPLTPSGSVLFVNNKQLFSIYDPNGLEMKYAYITWTSPKPWLYASGTIFSANDWAWGLAVTIKPGESKVTWTLPFQNLNFQLQGVVAYPTSAESVYFPAGSSPSFYDTPLSGYAFLNWYMLEIGNVRSNVEYLSTSNPWTFNLPSNSFSQAYNGPWFTLSPNVVQTSATFDVSAPIWADGETVSLTLTFPNGTKQTQTQTLTSANILFSYAVATFKWKGIPVGSYSWNITPVITYTSLYGTANASANPSSGSFTLSSGNNGTFEQGITYLGHTYTVTFTETGLPNGITWWAKLGSVTEQATTPNPIVFTGIPQDTTLSYSVLSSYTSGGTKYQILQASGTISVGTQNVTQQISYSTYYEVNVFFNPNYGFSNPQTVWVPAGGYQTFELTPEEDYYIAQPYSSSITAPSGISISYNSITKTTSGNTYVYNVLAHVNAPGNITVSLTWFNFIDYISESGLPSGQFWSFVIYQNGQEQSSNTALGSPISIEEPGYDYSTNNYYQYTITFSVINAGNVYYVPTSISTSAVNVLSKTSNSVTFEITGNTENNTNIITVTYTPYYALTINAGQGGSVSWSLVSGHVYGSSSGTVSTGQNQTVYVTRGTELQLTDNPNTGYTFTQWSFIGVQPAQWYSANSNPIEVVFTGGTVEGTGYVLANYRYSDYLKFTVSAPVNINYKITLSNGQSQSGNTYLGSSTVTFYLPYGTYQWSISPSSTTIDFDGYLQDYVATPSSSSATTNASVSINYVLSSSSYQYTWSESGLYGQTWGVSVNGNNYYTTSSSLTETFSTGQTYSWSVINPSGYVGTPSSGSFSSPGSQSITFYTTPSVTINANPSSGSAPLTVTFTAYASGGSGNYEYDFEYMDNSGNFQWSGWQYSNTFTYTYTSSGVYYAMVEVEDTVTGATAYSNYAQVTVSAPPLSVTIYAFPTSGNAPLGVQFYSSVSGGVGNYQYTWYFGDGGTSTQANPYYTYYNTGTYWAELYVQSGSQGAWSNQITITVTQQQPLSVSAYANPTSGTQPLTVTYSASGSGGSGSYYFTLYVDGNPVGNTVGPSSSATIQYTFSQAGTYSTYIQVMDANTYNTANSQTIAINVQAPAGTYSLTFTESGLPSTNAFGVPVTWSVTVNGQSQSADAGQSITFTGLSGTVSWSVQSPITVRVSRYHAVKYYAHPSSGTASSGGTISITYKDPPPVFSSVKVSLFTLIEKIINILNLVLQNVLLNFKIYEVLHSAFFIF